MESSSSKVFYEPLENIENRKLLSKLVLKCKEEMKTSNLHIPLEDYMGRVAHYTDLPKKYVREIVSEDLIEIDKNNRYFELNDQIEIYKNIAEMYSEQRIVTYSKIYTLFKKNKPNISYFQFQYMMNCLGFEYRKIDTGQEILIEDPSLTFDRFLYIKHINNFRAKCAPIYYIDARIFDSTYTFSKPLITSKHNELIQPGCDKYIFFNAVSKQGFLHGLFCSPATKAAFIKWITHIVIPLLPVPSVIVMDNNLHGSPIDSITKYHSKNDMLKYLRQRNIPCTDEMHKAELYNLITKCSVKHEFYDVDDILIAHGHSVLHLPANFHHLSITYYLWKYFLESEQNFLNIPLSEVKTVLLERLKSIPQKLWENFHDELVATEKSITTIDLRAYSALETFYYK